ncbi:hypothetical protein B296_00006621 [Ensete ventricosum]|uniref:Uncharacterized protein n=1 Tax=Ensete ventricosum TaxID=4639 RepID=A0A427ATL2_ENSVE|nr:hypothetical protein B296_00006621 [Ensete ventricosum]
MLSRSRGEGSGNDEPHGVAWGPLSITMENNDGDAVRELDISAGSVMQVVMLTTVEGKKGDGNAKMVVVGKKQRWDRWQWSLEQMTKGCELQWEVEMTARDRRNRGR